MAIDLNADMGTIIKELLAKRSSGGSGGGGMSNPLGSFPIEAYKYAIIITVAMLVVIGVYLSMIYFPLRQENSKKTEELNKAIEMKNQLSVLDGQIISLKKKLDKSKEEYIESLSHFGNSEDLGALYQTVSMLATKYGMVVLNIKELAQPKERPKPVAKKPAKKGAKEEQAPKKPAIDVKEIKVDVELKGHYGDYMKFKEDLALAAILLKINSESIMVKDEKEEQGSIYIKMNISTYAIDKKPFQGVVTKESNEEKLDEKKHEKAN